VLTTVLIGSVQKIERTTRNLLTYNYNCSFYQIINYEVITAGKPSFKNETCAVWRLIQIRIKIPQNVKVATTWNAS